MAIIREVPESKKGLILTESLPEVTRSTNKEFLRSITEEEKKRSKKVGYPKSENGHMLWNRDIYNALWVRDDASLTQIVEDGGSYHLNDAGEVINTAVAFNNVKGLEILLQNGASIKTFPDNFTPYMRIAFNRPSQGFTEKLIKLLEPLNIPVNAIDDFDHTALDHLSGVNNYTNIREDGAMLEFCSFLLEQGADPLRISSSDGLNPLQRASKKKLTGLVSLLSKHLDEKNED